VPSPRVSPGEGKLGEGEGEVVGGEGSPQALRKLLEAKMASMAQYFELDCVSGVMIHISIYFILCILFVLFFTFHFSKFRHNIHKIIENILLNISRMKLISAYKNLMYHS
jgi:hypothetical protein